MANQVISFRAQEKLAAAIELAAEMNGLERNEEIRMTLVLRYEPYMRILDAKAKAQVSTAQNLQVEVA